MEHQKNMKEYINCEDEAGREDLENEITPERLERLKEVLALRQKGLTLVLSNIHDPHNVSAIYRSCDAFGVPEVHLYYTDTAFPALSRRSSGSARKWVDTVRHRSLEDLSAALRGQGMQILSTSCSPQAKALDAYDFTRPTAIIMGNEHSGVSAEVLGIVDGELYIPMYGMIQSFNVSVAAAVILAEAARQRKQAGLYTAPTFSQAELDARLADWIKR